VGVSTGEAAVNLGATSQGMVAGDLVNTASRIQSAAQPGTVLVAEATRRATDAAVVYRDAGAHELKGKAEPVALWEAVRVVAATGGGQKSEGLEAPFVGRDRELRTVKDLFHAVSETGKAQFLSVIGMAGIGKSRLAWEFFKYADGLSEVFRWHVGRCLSYGEGVAYWALAEMVRTRAGIVEGEDAASARAKLQTAVEASLSDPEERRWVEPRVAQLLGLEDRVSADRDDLFAAWRLFYERLADERLTVMVFEDIQWADASLLDFVEYLMEWSRDHRLFVITLARPELLDRRPTWGAGKRNFTPLYLDPLPDGAMRELLEGLIPGLPAQARDEILARAEGVPLYAVETVRMLIDRGLLALQDDAYRPTGPIADIEVPQTLHALIAARLDGLSPEERHLVQDAAVLGKTFTRPSLAALSGRRLEELDALLSSLVRREVLSVQANPLSPERGQYGFLQEMVRTVAYETLSKRDRKAKHMAVAAYLEETWGAEEDEIAEVVASHYLQAYHAAPEAEDVKRLARDALVRAAERAGSLAAVAEAQGYLEQALGLTEDTLSRAELHERAGVMAWRAGRAAEAAAHNEEAMAAFESLGQSHPAARVLARLADVDMQAGHLETAVERMRRAFEVLSGDEHDEDLASLAVQLARLEHFSGRAEQAFEHNEFALELAEKLGLPEVLVHGFNNRALLVVAQGRLTEATTLLERAVQVSLDHNLGEAATRSYANLSTTLQYQDRQKESLAMIEAWIEMVRRLGDRLGELQAVAALVAALVTTGAWDEAVTRLDEIRGAQDLGSLQRVALELITAAPIFAHRGDVAEARRVLALLPEGGASEDAQTRAVYHTAEAALLRAEGRLEEARAAAMAAWAIRREMGLTVDVKDGIVLAIDLSLELGDVEEAERLLAEIDALGAGELTPFLRGHGARFDARLAALRGDQDRPAVGFQAAEDVFRKVPMVFPLAVTLLEHAEWLTSVGRSEEAAPLLDESWELFERLRARPWLERLAAARAVVPQLAPAVVERGS